MNDLRSLISAVKDSGADAYHKAKAYMGIAQNPNISVELFDLVMGQLLELNRFKEYNSLLSADHAVAKKYRETFISGLRTIAAKLAVFKNMSADAAVRIMPEKGDDTSLPVYLEVLAEELQRSSSLHLSAGSLAEAALSGRTPRQTDGGQVKGATPKLPILPDFDPTIATAHQLLSRTVQALAISRFVLINGRPASGKTEVGRYLGGLLNWETNIVNCHRNLGKDDMMQRVGVVANGDTSFIVVDGQLADALINGKLFILNEMNLAKPGSLSFLFSILADVNQEFDYYDMRERRVVKRKIHPNARFIGTMNPDGPERKEINAALKNRAVEIAADEYSDLELAAIVRSKYSELGKEMKKESEAEPRDMAELLVRFYRNMVNKTKSRAIGGHAEGYVWNLRHLMRLADGFSVIASPAKRGEAIPSTQLKAGDRHAPSQGSGARDDTPAQKVLEIMYDSIGVSLTPADREVFFDEVRNYKYNGIEITPADVAEFKARQSKLTLNEVVKEFGLDEAFAAKLAKDMKLRDIPTTARLVHAILHALKSGYQPWLKGPAGTGKTKDIEFAARLLTDHIWTDTLTSQTDESQLKGELKPVLIELPGGKTKLGFENVPSALVNALREANDPSPQPSPQGGEGGRRPGEGDDEAIQRTQVSARDRHASPNEARDDMVICILDEAGFARPDVIEELNSLLDRDGGIWVIAKKGDKPELLKLPKNFRLILSSNVYGYGGINLQSDAFRSRTKEIYADFEYNPSELAVIMGAENVEITPSFETGGRTFVSAEGPVAAMAPVTGPAPQIENTVPPALGSEPPTAKEVPPITGWSAVSQFGADAQRWLNRMTNRLSTASTDVASRTAKGAKIAPMGESSRFDSPTPVRSALTGVNMDRENRPIFSEAEIERMESRFAEVKNRLLGSAVSMGRTSDMTIRFDPATKTASMTVNEVERVYSIGPNYLLNRTTDQLINTSLHEGAHADITGVGSGFFFETPAKELLFGATEDIRANARVVDRMPGRREEFLKDREERYSDALKDIPGQLKLKGQVLPHEAFLEGLMSREYGGTSAWNNDPIVGKALDKAWGGVQRAKDTRPREYSPSRRKALKGVIENEEILKKEVWPVYEELYQQSVKNVEKMIEDGTITPDGGDGSGLPISIDPKDLSDAAKKIIDKRSQTIIDKLKPEGTVGNNLDKARGVYGKNDGEPKRPGKKPKGAGGLFSALAGMHDDHKREQASLRGQTYSKYISDLKGLADQVFMVFDRLLKPNSEFEYEENHSNGSRVDVKKALKAIHGMLTNLRVFYRKTEPTERKYRFNLLLDASGSMAQDPARERGGLGMAALFVDVFERLGIEYALDAFHEDFYDLKKVGDSLKTVEARNAFFNYMLLNIWGGPATDIRRGLAGSLNKMIEARSSRGAVDVEFLFVLTDGDETNRGGPSIRALCEKAARNGIIVVGIGIGEGMNMVKNNFPIHLVESNPQNLPNLLAEFIKEYAKMLASEDQ